MKLNRDKRVKLIFILIMLIFFLIPNAYRIALAEDNSQKTQTESEAYTQVIAQKIRHAWKPAQASKPYKILAVYSIKKNGDVFDITIKQSEGKNDDNVAAIRALQSVSPLPPLPKAIQYPSVRAEFVFDYNPLTIIKRGHLIPTLFFLVSLSCALLQIYYNSKRNFLKTLLSGCLIVIITIFIHYFAFEILGLGYTYITFLAWTVFFVGSTYFCIKPKAAIIPDKYFKYMFILIGCSLYFFFGALTTHYHSLVLTPDGFFKKDFNVSQFYSWKEVQSIELVHTYRQETQLWVSFKNDRTSLNLADEYERNLNTILTLFKPYEL